MVRLELTDLLNAGRYILTVKRSARLQGYDGKFASFSVEQTLLKETLTRVYMHRLFIRLHTT